MLGDFARLLNATGTDIAESKVTPASLSQLVGLIEEGTISTTGAKGVFENPRSRPTKPEVRSTHLEVG